MWNKKDGKLLGKKTLRTYSAPFDLSRYAPERWVTADSIDWLAEELDSSPHSPIAPRRAIKNLRPATAIETEIMKVIEWTKSGKKSKVQNR